jgi:adenosylcobinamide-GDP ribazoletransferase
MTSIVAAFVFFTRLPFWRFKFFQAPAGVFSRVIHYWAVVGWLTGGTMAGVLWLSAQVFPYAIAVVLALLSRLLLTGALHEDGLADFIDGFGGGNTKGRILEIMKDSHIGTYGAIGLIVYFLLLHGLLSHLSLPVACVAILAADPFCKFISSLMTSFLPYARAAGDSKARVVYERMQVKSFVIASFFGLTPLLLVRPGGWVLPFFPLPAYVFLLCLMKKKIGGYTGDCCGAIFLLCELSFYMGVVATG